MRERVHYDADAQPNMCDDRSTSVWVEFTPEKGLEIDGYDSASWLSPTTDVSRPAKPRGVDYGLGQLSPRETYPRCQKYSSASNSLRPAMFLLAVGRVGESGPAAT